MLKKTREHLNNYHCTSHENGEMVRAAPPSNHLCRKPVRWFWRHSQRAPTLQRRPAPTAIQTQPLSNRVLRACAYQRTRQRNIGIDIKILLRLWTTIWQRKDVWKTLFQNKSSGTINPVYLPRKTPEHYKECANQKKTVYLNSCPWFLFCDLGETSQEQPWPRSCSVLENVHWKENASTFILWTWGGIILKGIWSNFWNLRMLKNNLLNCDRSAGRWSPLCSD